MANALTSLDKGSPPAVYCRHEADQRLRAIILAFLEAKPLRTHEWAELRGFFQQWVDADIWKLSPALTALRTDVRTLQRPVDYADWRLRAAALGLDPL